MTPSRRKEKSIERYAKMIRKPMMMVAAFAATFGAWAANITLSFNASGGSLTTSQFTLGSQALTFDRTTIPSWITGLTLHQNIGGMINNTIGLTPATDSWNTSGSSSTCSLDVTVAENTGAAARSWTMNILNQSNGSVAWSMLVQQSAGSSVPSSQYTWTYSGEATSGLTITGVSPQPSGFVEIPAELDGMPVRTLGDSLFDGNSVVETIVVPDGVVTVGTGDKNDYQGAYTFQMPTFGGSLKDVYLPPTTVNVPFPFTFRNFNKATLHMTVGSMGFNCHQFSFANFYGALDIIALGGVPDGMVKPGLYHMDSTKSCTYRCKRAYKADWDQYLAGTGATFLGYIDDNYEYSDPVVVTFDVNGSDEGFVFAKMRGFELGALPVPVREGYVFAGWFTAAEGGVRVTASTIVAEDARYYAHWMSDRCDYAGYTWYYTGDENGLVITNVSPAISGSVCIPTCLNDVRVHRCMGTILDLSLVSKVVVPDGINSLWGNVFRCDYHLQRDLDVYLSPSVTNLANGYVFSQGHYTIHWTLAEDALSIYTYAFNAFYGTLEVTALGGVPLGMVKDGLYNFDHSKIVYICKRAHKAEWDAFFAGTTAEFAGYIADDYSYSDPVSTITFDPNGGMVAEACRTVANGSFDGVWPIPSKDGYAFNGWWTAAEGGRQISLGTQISGDAVWYAHWLPSCEATFDANGGLIMETKRRVPQNGTVGALPYPSRPGYQFDGWWTEATGGTPVVAKTVANGDAIYYAHWIVSPYEWQFTGDSESGLTITNVSPTLSGYVEVPATLYGAPIKQLLGEALYLKMLTASSIVVPNGVTEIGTSTFSALRDIQTDFFIPPSCNTLLDAYTYRGITGTVHWVVDGRPLSIHYTAFSAFYGTLDVVALGCVPPGMVKRSLYSFGHYGSKIVYRCKRTYKAEWDAFFEGTDATFLGYIDDDYEYLDPILTVNNGVLEDVQLMGGRDVVIPDGVTGICANAFAGNALLRSVTMPASVKAIASGAFTGCTGLESIAIPYSLDATITTVFPNGLGNVEIVFTGDDMTTGGDAEWGTNTAIVHGGIVSRRSGAIGDDQESWIEMKTQNPGRLSFWWKASSESDGDCVFDYAYLSIDDEPLGKLLTDNEEYQLEGVAIGGKTDWRHVELDVTGGGAHTIRWTYCKDEVDEGDTGEDCVWLDDVEFTPLVSVTFDLGGGTGTAPAGFVEMAGTVMILPDQSGFDRTDYAFEGWSDGTTLYLAGASYSTPYGDVTLTAQWIKKTFLTFDLDGGTGTAPAIVKELRGTVVTLPDQSGFDLTDYVFDGWSDGTTTYASGANYTMPSEDVTLTAQWIKKTFLAFDLGGGTGTAPEVVKELRGTVVALPDQSGFDLTDYVFDGWSDGTDTYSAGASYTMPSEDVTLTAQWIEKRFLTFTIDGGEGAVPVTIKDIPGAVVTLPTAEGFSKPKHTFVGWSDGTRTYLAGENYVIGAEGIALTAVWLPNELDIEISSSDVSDGGTNDAQGATISISAFAKAHESWAEDKRLLHRWSFNGELIDSVGGATAQIVGNVTTDGARYTTHSGGSGTSYIDLGDNLVPADAQAVTFEFWATLQESAYWARVFDFGSMTSEGYDFTVLDYDKESKDSLRMYWKARTTAHVFDAYGWTMNEGTEYHIAVSYAPGGDGIWVATYYVQPADGSDVAYVETQSSGDPTWSFASVGQTEWLLGQALTTWDETPGISYNEVRIWQAAMDEETFLANTAGGANATFATEAEIGTGDETIAPAIYYTLDGSEPTTNSTRYVEPFFADDLGDVTVKAIAVMDNYFNSDVATFSFTRLPYSAAECIGDPELTVMTGGDAAWSRVLGEEAHDGVAAMRSGAIGDSQSSYVEMTVRGSGSVSFWWRVSSQNKVRKNKHDYLSFTIDDIETATLGGGDINWTNETCSVADNGMHTLRWTYLKDAANASNEDCAWLDDVAWTPDNNDPLPEIGSSAEVALVLAGSTDSRLVAHIATKTDYDGFRTWVDEKGLSHKTVMDSRRAWFSYAIRANGLIDRVFGNEDVNIVSIVPMAGGVLTFDAAVAGAPVGAGASPERLASVFAVEGADMLSEEAFSTNSVDVTFAAGLDGRLAVSVTPKVSGDAFFMKLKVYPDFDAGNDGGTRSTDPAVTSATVIFDANGGSEVTPVVRMIGSELGELPATAREGHDFGGWFTEPDNGSLVSSSVVVTGDVKYYAHWTEKAGAEGEDALYVDAQAGSDLNTGLSVSSAKATIQSAVNAASEGSVIYVAAGTYAPFYTDNKSIRIVGKGGAGVTFVDGGGDYCLANSIHLASGSGGWDNIGNPVQTNTVVEGLTMQNLCTVKGGTIRRCVIRNNDCGNVGGAPVNCSVLENCLITGCRGMNGCASDGCLLRNCTITGNSARDMKYVFLDTIAINCIAYNNVQGSYGLDLRWKTAEHRLVSDAEFWTKNVCTEDPFFVDAANGDYRLRKGSPCINAGDNGYVFGTKDLNGDTRIVGGCVDIGCYESDL